jgi:hypothetical protein
MKPEKGHVHLVIGQKFKIDGDLAPRENTLDIETDDNGVHDLWIQLLDDDYPVTFIHTESGESVRQLLLKEG